MRKFFVHYATGRGREHIRVIMEGDSHRAVATIIQKANKGVTFFRIEDIAQMGSSALEILMERSGA